MIVKNEEDTLEKCLSNITRFVKEIIVGTGSSDKTKERALKYTGKVFYFQ
jgi:glycosyltransferase involved in cell wall biosynthesis